MFTSFSERALKALLAIPDWDLIPTPTRETFPIFESTITSLKLTSFLISSMIASTADFSSIGTVKVKSVFPSTLTFCTITSTSMSALLIGPRILKAVPGISPIP